MDREMRGVLVTIGNCHAAVCTADVRRASGLWGYPALVIRPSGPEVLREDNAAAMPRLCGLRCAVSDRPARLEGYRRLNAQMVTVRMALREAPDRPAGCPLPCGTFLLSRVSKPAHDLADDMKDDMADDPGGDWRIKMLAYDACPQ